MFLNFMLILFLSFSKYLPNHEMSATSFRENEDKENYRENNVFDEDDSIKNPTLTLLDNIGDLGHQTKKLNKNQDENDIDMQTLKLSEDNSIVGSENGYSLDESKVQHLESMKDEDSDEEEYERLDEDWIQKEAADGQRRRRRRTRTVRLPAPCVESDGQVCRWLLVDGELKYVCERVTTTTCN
uniref:Cnidarian restricted protein n=1 Tax=Clytia hemisphaerica TaxID=252671 RepID=A0A7M6DN46_9CNID|eukprot:TCONS_00021858-protein